MKYKLKLDYTTDELNELKGLIFCDSPMHAVMLIVEGNAGIKALTGKYTWLRAEEEFDFMADVNNVLMGTAIFPKQKLYIVRDKGMGAILRNTGGVIRWSQNIDDTQDSWVKKTKEEWLDMNPAYESMLEEVE